MQELMNEVEGEDAPEHEEAEEEEEEEASADGGEPLR